MSGFILGVAVVLLLLVGALLYRVCVGPTAIDRIVAVNAIGTKTTVLLVLIGLRFDDVGMFVDFALAYGLLNFMGSLAAARYFQRSDKRAHESERHPAPVAPPGKARPGKVGS